jgi:hypothetical protein
MGETCPAEDASRCRLFQAARESAGWSIEQMWLHYVALAGTLVVFDLEAFLAGLAPIPPAQQDVLACALNERLAELHQDLRVPYLTVVPYWLSEHLLQES